MLENQLLLRVVFQQDGVLVKRADFARELDAAHQVNGDRALVLADRVQKGVLNILCRLRIHNADLPCCTAAAEPGSFFSNKDRRLRGYPRGGLVLQHGKRKRRNRCAPCAHYVQHATRTKC